MKLKQICVPIENSHDRLTKFTRALGERGINLKAFNLVDTGDLGEFRFLVSDVEIARQVLMQKHIPARVDDVVAVELDNRPGRLSNVLENLRQSGIRVKYAYPSAGIVSGRKIIIFCFSDNDKAIEVLSENKARLLDNEALGLLDTAA
jgi:hypothetical protein